MHYKRYVDYSAVRKDANNSNLTTMNVKLKTKGIDKIKLIFD